MRDALLELLPGGRRRPSRRAARAPTRRGRSRSAPAGRSARCATGGSACRPRASACARASRCIATIRSRNSRDRGEPLADRRRGPARLRRARARSYLRAHGRGVVGGDVGDQRRRWRDCVIFIGVPGSGSEGEGGGLVLRGGREEVVEERRVVDEARDRRARGTPGATGRRTGTPDPVQRIASTMRSGSDHASTTRSRPRSFTAWWWIELVLTSVAPGYSRARPLPGTNDVAWQFSS